MCGITGVISPLLSPEIRNKFDVAFDCLKHRGPQGNQKLEFKFPGSSVGNLIFGHHRLAIVDLNERANQPLISKNGSLLAINGEIYNAHILREQLKNRYEFVTTSDSEVALATLEVFGLSGVSKLDGMFAFAFYPAGESSVWLGRDRIGIKPLYFTRQEENVWFSSEAKPLAKALSRNLDELGISEWVQYQFQVSQRTFFNEIYSVPPGHVLTIKDGLIKSRQYWNLEDHLSSNNGSKISTKEAINTLRELTLQSVNRHLMSDVEVATITSGGMDSSSVSVLAAKHGVKEAFIGRYLESGYDESNYARLVAQHAKLNLNIIDISQNDFFEALQQVASTLDYPTAGPGSVGQYLVSREVAKTHRVVLAGTGGDELFLGYTRDRFPLWAAKERVNSQSVSGATMPKGLQGYESLFRKFLSSGGWESPISGFMATLERRTKENALLSIPKHRQVAVTAELQAFISPTGGESLNEVHDSLLRYEVLRFLPSLLQVEDRMTMAHGLESRVPFLDLELIEFLLALPFTIRMSGNNPKDLLRFAMADELPKEILAREDKMGFPVPFVAWGGEGQNHQAQALISSLQERQIPGILVNRLSPQSSESHIEARELWGGLILESWLRTLE
jgi:asparagine synthase (glutamine-hydrolysing)